MEIRLGRVSDIPQITLVRTSVNENHLSVEQMEEMGITEASTAQMITASPCCWVAVVNAKVVGFSMVNNEDGCLFAAFVLPDYEGQGIGSSLLEVAEEQLFKVHSLAWLETTKSSHAASFYRNKGWGNEKLVGPDYIRLEKTR